MFRCSVDEFQGKNEVVWLAKYNVHAYTMYGS